MTEDNEAVGGLPDIADLPRAEWLTTVRDLATSRGDYFELDADHDVIQVGQGDRLIVTFESSHDIRNNQDDGLPVGLKLAQSMNVAVITIFAKKPTWFRSRAIYDFFDQLTDEGVFESYEHVAFFGAGMGGYGAAAFSVAAPGSDVVAISPQATLDARMTEWDPRFVSQRKRSFTDRYGYAPDMVEAARNTLVLYNPEDDVEAMHATLFARDGVTRFRCRYVGPDVQATLMEFGIFDAALDLASKGELSLWKFADLYRARRNSARYLKNLLVECEDQDRPQRVAWLAGSVLKRKKMPAMRRALENVTKRLETPNAAE